MAAIERIRCPAVAVHTSSGDHHAYHALVPATVSATNLSRATLTRRHRRHNRSAFFQRDAADHILRGTRRLFPFAETRSREERSSTTLPNQVSRGPSPNDSVCVARQRRATPDAVYGRATALPDLTKLQSRAHAARTCWATEGATSLTLICLAIGSMTVRRRETAGAERSTCQMRVCPARQWPTVGTTMHDLPWQP